VSQLTTADESLDDGNDDILMSTAEAEELSLLSPPTAAFFELNCGRCEPVSVRHAVHCHCFLSYFINCISFFLASFCMLIHQHHDATIV